jgi:hypothetical protein
MQTVTAKDIAEKIQRPGEALQVAVDRLRNWTREGLIKPVGAKHPGKGRAKQYPRKAIFEAALLQVLIDCTGIGAINAGPLLDAAKKLLGATVKEGFENSILVIGRSAGVAGFYMNAGRIDHLAEMIRSSGAQDTHTIVNLKSLFDRALSPKD